MNMRTNLASALLALGICFAAMTVGARVYFTDNFRNYAMHAPGVSTNLPTSVGNDPIWNVAANLNIRPRTNQTVLVYGKGITLPSNGAFDLIVETAFLNAREADAEKGVAAIPAAFDIVFSDSAGKEQAIRVTNGSAGGLDFGFTAANDGKGHTFTRQVIGDLRLQ